MKKKICISFDYEQDNIYRNLMKAWDANPNFGFELNDKTPAEIDSSDYGRIKAVLTQKISQADYLLILVGAKTNTRHPKSAEIGERNWQIWETKKAFSLGKKIVAVRLNSSAVSPEEIKNIGASWAISFTQAAIIKALN